MELNPAFRERGDALSALLAHLDESEGIEQETWQRHTIRRISGGWNSLLYRVTGPLGDYALKFAPRDERDRAGREYAALSALQEAGLSIAPAPVLLDREAYRYPVTVQTWLSGDVREAPPDTERGWARLIEHYALVHTVTPAKTTVRLSAGVLAATSVAEAKALVTHQIERLPDEGRPAEVEEVYRRLLAEPELIWPTPEAALCRIDANTLNLIRRPGRWASVDWENSGWTDPAFDVADLITHPAYAQVAPGRWQAEIATYCHMSGDPSREARIAAYRRIMLVWWLVRSARYMYEIPRGLDQRLTPVAASQMRNVQDKYEHYLRLAAEAGYV